MTHTPDLFDPQAVRRNRARAQKSSDPAVFLHREAQADLSDRVSLVNKSFTAPAIVTGWPTLWAETLPDALLFEDHDALGLGENTNDLILHALCLHWANDPVGQLIQCRRALRPDGLFLAVLFGGQTLHELRASLAQAEADVTGGLSPRVAPMAEIRDLGALMQRAGFALPVADSQAVNVRYESLFHLLRDVRAMGETNALHGRMKQLTRRQVFLRAAEIYAQSYPSDDGGIVATFELIFLTGWAPDDSQPKPLRPGTATTRLADALKSTETKLDPLN